MGDVIRVNFRKVRISREEYLRGADRCERTAMTQDRKTAAALRRLARSYRHRAGQI